MSLMSNLDLIRRVPLFSMLTIDQAQVVADSVVKRRLRRGELVVEQGRTSNALFILLNGRARVLTADSRGREVILAVLEAGDYVGEMSLIDHEPYSATVRAEIQTDMLVLARATSRVPPDTRRLPRHLARRCVAAQPTADRSWAPRRLRPVARTLLAADDDSGVKTSATMSAARTGQGRGASREMVSRVMKDLEEKGVIETQENGFVILKDRLQNG